MIFVITKSCGEYESRWDQPIAVRSNFVDAKKTAEAALESPGENWRRETLEYVLIDVDQGGPYYNIHSTWRSLILPRMEPMLVYGPTIWPVDDHDKANGNGK